MKPHILIVEDIPTLAESYAAYLRREDADVAIVETGAAALARLASAGEAPVALLIFDIVLSDMDGMSLQACALNEIFEKTGLQIRLTQHLIDSKRSGSYTRYYLAERIGGNQAGMRHVLGKSGGDAGAGVAAADAADQSP
mgnify:CR=1 FL=1